IAKGKGPTSSGFLIDLWETFIATFGLSIPIEARGVQLVLWFILTLGGIFVVSALVGVLVSSFAMKVEQLRKERSIMVERNHTVILAWSDQVSTVVSDLVEANHTHRRAAITILAEQNKVDIKDWLRHRLGSTAT